jgi:serine/threonine protein kinase
VNVVDTSTLNADVLKDGEIISLAIGFVLLLVGIIFLAWMIVYRKRHNRKREEQRQAAASSAAAPGPMDSAVDLTNYSTVPDRDQISGTGSINSSAGTDTGSIVRRKSSRRRRNELESSSGKLTWRINPDELELGAELGRGAFGIVRQAMLHGRKVAVKQLKLQGAGEEEKRAFENEVGRMSSLPPHECCVQLLGVTELNGDPAAVVEFCAGGSMLDVLYGSKRRDFSPTQLMNFAHDAACGLAHLHRHAVIHRDIAARNVLLAGKTDLVAKIADFGMAREGGAEGEQMQTAQAVGPIAWMSPEQIEKLQYSAASDVFAFGVLLFEIFARERPWVGVQLLVIAKRVLDGERMTPPASAPTDVQELMLRCWSASPSDRPDMNVVRRVLKTGLDAGEQ